MTDVRIMKKIIVQIYNILQVLWSSKVTFVSLSQLLGCPLFGFSFGLFRVPGFIVSLVGIKKKDGRKKRYKGRERRSRARKKEREEEGDKERKNNNEELLKKKKASCWLQTDQASFAGLFWL